jgi:kynureninase
MPTPPFKIITPRDPKARGSQISLLFYQDAEQRLKKLEKQGVICDFRPSDIIRVTPSPLYTSFSDIYKFMQHFLQSMES